MFSRSTTSRRAPEGGTGQLAGNVLALDDLHALVVKLEARMGVQEKKVAVLEQENSELWQEIHRLKGPRLPLEIFFLIVSSARDDKKALTTFSLVSKSWMHIARETLFAKISLRGVKPLPFLNNPHCTIFPYVQVMGIDETDDTRGGMPRGLNWLDDSDFLLHMPKFTALMSLDLESFDSLDFDNVIWAMPPAMRGRIKQLGIYNPDTPMFALTSFISNFTNLIALKCGEMYGGSQDDALARLLPTNEALAPPPSSIKKLLFRESGHLPSNILKWFTDRHPGGIKLFRPNDLQRTHPVEFRNFIRRFRASLLKTELSISNEDDIDHLQNLRQLTDIVLNFGNIALHWLPNIIAQLPPSIEKIEIFVEAGDLSRSESAATWPEVDRTLAGTTFPALRNVTMAVTDSRDNEKHKQQMWKLLPLCIKKHILYGRRDGRGRF